MRVVVTGGAGYIGSHTCKYLASRGHTCIAYDNLSRGDAAAVRWGELEVGELLDEAKLDEVFRRFQPEAVVHLAALAYVGESMSHPDRYYRTNVSGTQYLLDAMLRHRVRRIVFSSSCATYGNPKSLPINELEEQKPVNPYGRSKLIVEQVLADYGAAYGIRSVSLRFFNAAGADPDGELGESHQPETHAIPLAIKAALGTGPSFQIMGSDYPTPDGTAVRDYIHVSDLAEAHVAALERSEHGPTSECFNLGTGTGTSVLDMIRAVESATGRRVPTIYSARRPGDPPILVASAERARTCLGWRPKHATISGIVATAVPWFSRGISTDVRDGDRRRRAL